MVMVVVVVVVGVLLIIEFAMVVDFESGVRRFGLAMSVGLETHVWF